MKRLIVCVFILCISGCAYPTAKTSIIDDRPILGISGSSNSAILFVDDLEIGLASAYDGNTNILRLEPGTHNIKVRDDNTIFYNENIYLGSGSKRIINVGGF